MDGVIRNDTRVTLPNINTDVNTSTVHCKQCENTFMNENDYNEHNTKKLCIRKFTCGACGVSFKRRDHLKRHTLSVHSNVNYYTCPICSENCLRKDSLKKHINLYHYGEAKTFSCRECSYECKTLDDLDIHKSTHLLSEWHYCQHCKMPFKRRDHMLRHIKTQHSNMSAECPLCKQVFKRTDHVSRHIREKHRHDILNAQ